uniref:Uncharacterized protein n=1 Tax=uncultured bacterium ws034A6 TaxID=1131824 RepID=I1X587_9BACT|nr:hypothetical protein ws034A6_0031 [uncultured bacterium ws034A6]
MSASWNATAPVTPLDNSELAPTLAAIRTNCHISDARHATDYTLCVYLLKMREYFRWENNIPFHATLPREQLTAWLTQREEHWDDLENSQFESIPVQGSLHDPFDSPAINKELNELGYIYSSGYGRNMKPVFFLGELEQRRQHDGYTLLVSGKEFARDLSAPPAMSLDNTIFVRRESLRRMCWEKIEEWRWNEPENAMQKAMMYYDFDSKPDASLDAMTDMALQSVLFHEIGEVQAGKRLGNGWKTMLSSMQHSKAEIMLRAVRDNLADALSTLPGLLREADEASIHFYMANMSNMRKKLFPAAVSAYENWSARGDIRELELLLENAVIHWQSLAETCLELHKEHKDNCEPALIAVIEANIL